MRYPVAEWKPSPNHSSRGNATVDLICIHQTDGGPSFEHAASHLCKPEAQVSAHFVIGRCGEVAQLVDTDYAAWHDSGRNKRSIGIEHVARTPGELNCKWDGLSKATKQALGAKSSDALDPGLLLTEEQLDASAALVAWLLKQLDLSIDSVVPHCSNPSSTHRDCGRDVADGGIWDWSDYRRRINAKLAD